MSQRSKDENGLAFASVGKRLGLGARLLIEIQSISKWREMTIHFNLWFGGKTSLNGVENPVTLQKSSRVGATASVPLTKHQSLKFSYSNGAYVSCGGDCQIVPVAWQYTWSGRPKLHQD